MPSFSITLILQVVVGLGILNVWILRAKSPSAYRGGSAVNLKSEFAEYGLPDFAFYAVGLLKIGSALALLAGIWISSLVAPAAAIVAVLMVGAMAMHLKVKDPFKKALPSFLMLVMCAAILYLG